MQSEMKSKPASAGRRLLGLLLAGGLLVLGGCAAVGPDYAAPERTGPAAWHTQLEDGLRPAPPDAAELAAWWKKLNDPLLDRLMQQAVAGNLDLKEALARVREARARRGVSRADLYPTLDAAGSWAKVGTSGNGLTQSGEYELYSAGLDAGWEIDVFGGVRRKVEASQADLEAGVADLGDVMVSLTAEVAFSYVETRTYQHRLDVAKNNLRAQSGTYDLINSRFQAGLSDELALMQARYNLETTRSQIPSLETGLEQSMNRLAVLLGRTPGSLHRDLQTPSPIPQTPATVAVGVPAEMLRRRPDIRRAERQLAAQTARVGEATADLYPKFKLTGSIGLESVNSNNFLDSGSFLWSVLPSVSWKLFQGGAVRQNIEVQSALQEQALHSYEAAILSALEEVENGMTGYVREQIRRERLAAAVEAARQAEALSRDRYKAGLVDFSNVLDAQRSLLSLEDQLAQSEGAVTSDLISLYKALGGGWSPMAEEES